MYRPIIISIFLIGLLMTSTILPFTNNNNFSNTASAQEMGYYDDEYVEYNSDINYDSDDETYSDYQDKENKYECRTGPFEGFFVSSPEFCKHINLDDKKDDRKKDSSRDNNTNNNNTGTPNPQNVTLDAKFPELRHIADPNELVILDGSGSTGTITSWSIVQTGGQPSVTLQDVPSKQYSKQFIMPNTNDTLIFELTIRNDQTEQQDTETIIVMTNQTLAALACFGVTPDRTNYKTIPNVDDNFIIPYPEEFIPTLGDSIIPGDPDDKLGDPTLFFYIIPADPTCKDVTNVLNVHILQAAYNNQSRADLIEYMRDEINGLPSILYPSASTVLFFLPPPQQLVHGKHIRAILEHSLILIYLVLFQVLTEKPGRL